MTIVSADPSAGTRGGPAPPGLSERAVAGLVLLLAVAATLRFWRLAREGLWYDELIMANLTSGPWGGVWQRDAHRPAARLRHAVLALDPTPSARATRACGPSPRRSAWPRWR